MSMNSTLNITFQEQVQAYHGKIDQQLDQTLQLLRSKLLAQQELDRARCEQQRENFFFQVDQELGRQMLDIDKWRQSQQSALINALQSNPQGLMQNSQGSTRITKSTLNDDMKNIPDLETESLPHTAVPTPVGETAIDFKLQHGHKPDFNQPDWVRNCPSPMKKNERRRGSSVSSGAKYSLGSIDYPPNGRSSLSPEHRPPKPVSPSCESMTTTVRLCPTQHGESVDSRVMSSVAPDAPVMPRGMPIAPLARTMPEIPRRQQLNLSPRIVPQRAPGNRALPSFPEPLNHSVPSRCNYQTIRPREKGFSERRCASPIVLARESVRKNMQMPAAFKPYAFGVPSSEAKSYAQRQESFGRRSSPAPIPCRNRSPKLISRDCRSPVPGDYRSPPAPRVMPWFARQQSPAPKVDLRARSPAPQVERQVIIPKGAIIYRYNSRRELVPNHIQL